MKFSRDDLHAALFSVLYLFTRRAEGEMAAFGWIKKKVDDDDKPVWWNESGNLILKKHPKTDEH